MNNPDITIKSNFHWREIVSGYDIPEKALEWYADLFDNPEEESFILYRGDYVLLSNFIHFNSAWTSIDKETSPFGPYWDGHHSQGFGCGLLIKLSDCGEAAQIARYY